jgi:ribose-phosphate pyrophosphokinase
VPENYSPLRVFCGNAHPTLAAEIAQNLGIALGKSRVSRLTDGETRVEIDETVRGKDVFVVQPTSPPVNETTMELLIMVDALRRASAKRITAVMPYYGYARQDLQTKAREPISAKVVANILTASGVDRIVCMDLHVPQIQGFFDIPMDHLTAIPILAKYLKTTDVTGTVVVSPDLGGVARARNFAERIGGSIAILEKKRLSPNQVRVSNVIGDVKNKHAIIIDDIIATASTVEQGSRFLMEAGAKSVSVCCSHSLLTGRATERLQAAPIQQVIVTNTIPIAPEKRREKLEVLSVGPLLAAAILAIHREESVSRLFNS